MLGATMTSVKIPKGMPAFSRQGTRWFLYHQPSSPVVVDGHPMTRGYIHRTAAPGALGKGQTFEACDSVSLIGR